MKHYIQRIDSDNLKQDFKTAMQEELKDIKSETENMVKQLQVSQVELQTSNNEYAKTIEARLNKNENAIKQYDQAVNKLTKGLTSMFFIVALVMVAFLVLSPLGDLLGIHYFYEWINHVLKTSHSVWRYFIVILYLIPYILLWLLICGILRAYKRVSSF
ncbi:mobilization protein [Staphylococcus aureus]|nr:mobilization protein [Staphylococcus aureus]MBZ8165784.1 mobilization protein [Staphylococcus aureus]MBZ8168542.1 mobilization protein [Staphylococcus aureus]MBZ8171141.1 mobilization protein [Staphylococcus aureus]HDZ8766899.1 mobilization protein [Staphylococcus aureus]